MNRLLLLTLILGIFTYSWAYDFKSGDLYYNITSNSAPYTVEVTYSTTSSPSSDDINYASLTSADIPSVVSYNGRTYNVTSIGDYAFSRCSSIISIFIPNSITSIGIGAFYECSSLTYITIPDSITVIKQHTFSHCSSLSNISIPEKVTTIKSWAFAYCLSLISITIPNNVTSIEDRSFLNCSSLESVTGGENVKSIGEYAFGGCQSLRYLLPIGKNVTTIGRGCCDYCYSLISIVVDGENAIYDSRNNCNAIIETSTNTLIVGCRSTSIPEGVTSIGQSAFATRLHPEVKSINIPSTVTIIGDHAFALNYLTTLYVRTNTPPLLGPFAFMKSGFDTCQTIPVCYIPCGTLTAYQKSDWKNYMSCFIEECVDLLIIPYDATSLLNEERNANPNHIIYPATLENRDSVEMRCN